MNIKDRHEIGTKINTALNRIDAAIKKHDPIAVLGLFSGGHDSFSATYCASFHPNFSAAIHINTGIGVEATRRYVRDTCHARSWRLIEYLAADNRNAKGEHDPQSYEKLCLKYGFPGPYGHGMMYARLKQRALQRLARLFGANCRGKYKHRIMLISGCRSEESRRRMGNTEEVQIDGQRIWVAPIHDWTKLDTSHCLEYAKQERNLVVDLIHKSGECLCGAFAKEGELEELNEFDLTRDAYNEIKRIEGLVKPVHGWGWGEKPRKKQPCPVKPSDQHLCTSCNLR